MSLKIGVCDDEPLVAESLKRLINDCLEEIKQKADVSIFLSGKEFLEAASELDAVFLDIRMPEMDGYETLRRMERLETDCQVIVASGETERFEEAFELGAFRYIRKPFQKEKVAEAVRRIVNRCKEKSAIELYKERSKYNIKQKDIKYVKAYNGYTEYSVGKDIMRKELSLNEAEEILDDKLFFRVNKKYSVNMGYIVSYRNGTVMIDGLEIPVSRRRKNDFDKAYLTYCMSRGE